MSLPPAPAGDGADEITLRADDAHPADDADPAAAPREVSGALPRAAPGKGGLPQRGQGAIVLPFMTPASSILESRWAQTFPTLEPAELDRLRRFGERRTWGAGEHVVTSGEVSPGMVVVLSGELAISQHNP